LWLEFETWMRGGHKGKELNMIETKKREERQMCQNCNIYKTTVNGNAEATVLINVLPFQLFESNADPHMLPIASHN
jgi:hypothetical protein